MQNLDSKWSQSATKEIGMPLASMDVIEMIDRQARTMNFWSVKPTFFAEYPQYTSCF